MRPSEALAKHRDEILAVLARFPVSNPRVFGSVARGEDVEGSDLDILVDAEPGLNYFDLAEMEITLRAVAGCPVDLGVFADLKPDVAPTVARDMRPIS